MNYKLKFSTWILKSDFGESKDFIVVFKKYYLAKGGDFSFEVEENSKDFY